MNEMPADGSSSFRTAIDETAMGLDPVRTVETGGDDDTQEFVSPTQPMLLGQLADTAPEADSAPRKSYVPGSKEDFDRLYRDSYHRLLYTILAVVRDYAEAEDCVQETFVKAYRAWKDWTPDAPAEAWLHRIGLNIAFSYRRWQALREVGEVIKRFGGPKVEADPADVALRGDLFDALRRLPPDQAATVIMRHHHGYTNREIAAALGLPESTIASRLATAKKRLREELK